MHCKLFLRYLVFYSCQHFKFKVAQIRIFVLSITPTLFYFLKTSKSLTLPHLFSPYVQWTSTLIPYRVPDTSPSHRPWPLPWSWWQFFLLMHSQGLYQWLSAVLWTPTFAYPPDELSWCALMNRYSYIYKTLGLPLCLETKAPNLEHNPLQCVPAFLSIHYSPSWMLQF